MMQPELAPSATPRIRRELHTVHVMIRLSCRRRHGAGELLCAECESLWAYARRRVELCQFGADKPTCANCSVHCFKPAMRERIRDVMRFAGPHMIWRHPVLALRHILDGRHVVTTKGGQDASPADPPVPLG